MEALAERSAISVEHIGGVGANTRYRVMQNGQRVATISRYGIDGYYGLKIASPPSLTAARELARTLTYPTVEEAYERTCETVYRHRLRALEKHFTHRIAAFARQTIDGSNSGRAELANLLDEIEKVARDRLHSTEVKYQREVVAGEEIHSLMKYPKTPDEYRAELAGRHGR